jgi:hypothetical protein
MTSTTATATRANDYTLLVTQRNTWRLYHNKNKENTRQHLEQYYFNEDASNERSRNRLQKSFPYHHCLTKASHHSSQTVLDAQCLYPYFKTKRNQTTYFTNHVDSMHAVARVHENENSKTPFTEITAFQKTHLIAQSAMTGLLVSRLFGISCAKPWTIQCSKKHADLTAKYIHSALASECLIGCRYYYNLPRVIQDVRTVGHGRGEQSYTNLTAEDATFEKIQETRAQLIALYSSNISRLEHAIKQFNRGFLSLQTIREDPDFKKLFQIFWLLQSQCMKYRDVVTSGSIAHQIFCEKNNIAYDSKSINIMLCNTVFSCQAICPRLFSYDVAQLFDNCTGSYARYVKTTKAKQLELCSQGLISAFLTFSAIEPNLVSECLAPHMEKPWHYPSDFSSYAFHIPSRDTIFGPLVSKHRRHIPRHVNIERTFFMTRNNKDCFYLPMQEVLTELQTGKKAAKESWKKNKKNFKENRIVTTNNISKRIV